QKLHDLETQPPTNQVDAKSKKAKKAETSAPAPAATSESAAAAAPAPAPVVEAAPAAAAAPVLAAPAPAPTPTPAAPVTQPMNNSPRGVIYAAPHADPEATAKAQDALRQKMSELDAKAGKQSPAPIYATNPDVITPNPVSPSKPVPVPVGHT